MTDRVTRGQRDFPEKVYQFSPDVRELYFEGDLSLAEEKSIAVVGSRKCTAYGRVVAREIGRKSASNQVVLVSGLAKGIDTEGHKGVLESDGKTIAVLGGGVSCYYPAENKALQQSIGKGGLLLSEHPPAYVPKPFDFPKRNRIISALADSIVVVEAPNRSGALITAECGAEQGKEVYAVPGNINSHYSFGTNKLIREGVTPLILLDDVFLDMGLRPFEYNKDFRSLGEEEKIVFAAICQGGEMTLDEISVRICRKPSEVNCILTVLEMKGLIFSSMGKFFVAKM